MDSKTLIFFDKVADALRDKSYNLDKENPHFNAVSMALLITSNTIKQNILKEIDNE